MNDPHSGLRPIHGSAAGSAREWRAAEADLFALGDDALSPQALIGGTPGNDSLVGTSGKDTLDGGAGSDTMSGGAGNDTYLVDDAGDVPTEASGQGTDTVIASLSWTLGANLEHLTLTGSGDFDATGNGLKNNLTGNAGNNVLNGGGNADNMAGGAGDDSYIVDNGGDVVTEVAGQGEDTVFASVSFALSAQVESLTLTGSGNLNGTGNELDNTLIGNAGRNKLDGGTGNDGLYGGLENDSLDGGLGNDALYGDDGNDTLRGSFGADDLLDGGAGADLLYAAGGALAQALGGDGNDTLIGGDDSSGSHLYRALDGGAGNDQVSGGAGNDDALYGGDGNDTVSGGGGNDQLFGEDGRDRLLGGSGADGLQGGAGNDVLNGEDGDDQLVEEAGTDTLDGGTGTDTLLADWSEMTTAAVWANDPALVQTVLGQSLTGIERMVLTLGSGNDRIANLTTDTADVIDGGFGNDSLDGGAGDDQLLGGEGNDTLVGSAGGNDTLDGGAGNDQLLGGSGNDAVMFGGDGKDTLTGNAGNDVLQGDAGDDRLLGGDDADSLYGGSGNDRLDGGNGDDQLFDEDGADTFIGGAGVDAFTADWSAVGTAIDWVNNPATTATVQGESISGVETLHLLLGTGNDTVDNSAAPANAGSNDLLLGGGGNDRLSGGAGDDALYGDDGDDTLVGGSGAGHLRGGAGNDQLTGGGGSDLFWFDSLFGSDVVTDFASGVDQLVFAQATVPVGNGDAVVDGAVSIAAPGGFSAAAELVIASNDIVGPLNAENAAAAIGDASEAYALGQTALFVVDDGVSSAVFYFVAADADATVSAGELLLSATLQGSTGMAAGDVLFGT